MSQHGQRPRTAPAAARALREGLCTWAVWSGLILASGCQSFRASAYNLRVLHEPDGSLAPRSATVAHWYYRWLTLTGDRPSAEDPAGEPRLLSRPRTKIRRETVRLCSAQPESPAERAEQLSLACFLATRDRSPVTRELALEAVAAAARRLGLEALPQAPGQAPSELELEAARALLGLAPGTPSSDLSALDLAAACALLDECLPRLRKRPKDRALLEAEALLARRAAGLALAQALEDPQDIVRARAARAVLEFDSSRLLELLESGLKREQPETVQAICEHLAEKGWPPQAGASEPRFELLIAAVDDPDDRASVAAARALARLTDGALVSLRPEEWLLWWEQRQSAADPAGAGLPNPQTGSPGPSAEEPAPAAVSPVEPAQPQPAPPAERDGN